MNNDMQEFVEVFLEEASEHLECMEGALLELETTSDQPELLNTVFRAVHSIKGTSATLGVRSVAEFTHEFESLLDRMRDGQLHVTPELTELLLESVDVLTGLLDATASGSPEPVALDKVLAQLRTLNKADSDLSAQDNRSDINDSPQSTFRITFRPSRDFFHFGLSPLLYLRDLAELGTVEDVCLDSSALPPIEQMSPESCYLAWALRLTTHRTKEQILESFLFVDDATFIEIVPEPKDSDQPDVVEDSHSNAVKESGKLLACNASANGSVVSDDSSRAKATPRGAGNRESVRVNGERLDDMINQIGELVIGISMVEAEWQSLSPDVESSAIVQLSKIVRDLQEQSLSMRMVPIAATFQKMNRSVRDLSGRLSKQVRFEVSGEETELDKTVVDQIGDPLVHMIRNSVDHGIESPEERIAAGKAAEGCVSVRAYHQGGNIYIEMQDDGKGLNPDSIRRKAVDRGLISADAKLTEQEIYDLVFEAGLSTAQQVSDVSGRGVGMDVVRRNVEDLKGSVSIASTPGQGTTVTVRLPLTLAILDGLLLSLGSEVYVAPLLSVVESFRPQPGEVKRLANDMEVVQVRGEVVPVLPLHSVLNVEGAVTDPYEGLLVIVEDHDTKFALLVDDLLGQQQAVIKNLESNFRKVPGIAGATILGDGRVALILDVVGLRHLVPSQASRTTLTGELHDCS
ncbi:MAG TPA: chemotaxis protein CheA [Planctomycetaceae bacterium]|nr:chemotaxis protein CheA [Planctomycetaceae bacterium]